MVIIASWMACPWVCDTLEMSTPVPRVTNRNSSAPSAKVATEPRNGTSKSSMPATTTITMSSGGDEQVGRDLAEEDVARPERHHGELLHGAALALAHHAERRGDGADEHEDDPAEAGDHDDGGAQARVEEDRDLDRGSGAAERQSPGARWSQPAARSSARLRSAACAAKSSVPSMSTVAAPPARWRDDRDHGLAALRSASCAAALSPPASVATTSKRRRESGRHSLGSGADDHGGDVLDVEARRVPEHDEEEERQQEQHRQRAPVAAQLPELLDRDGPHGDRLLRRSIRFAPCSTPVEFITR